MRKKNAPAPELAIRQLRHFLLVAQQGSFQAAASKAFRSQPAITKSIQAIEGLLGQPLFEPGQRSAPTAYGLACQPLVEELLVHYDRMVAAMQSLASGALGRLTLASIASVSSNWLPAIVSGFMRDHPDVDLHLRDSNSQSIEAMVLAGEVDLGICSPVEADSRLQLTPLMEDPFGFVCRPDHPLAARRSLSWSSLSGLPLLGTTAHRQLDDPRAVQALSRAQLNTEGILTLLGLLREGVGVTVLPKIAVPRDAGSLVFIPLTAPRLTRRVYVMRLRERTPSPAASIMLERLLEAANARAPRQRARVRSAHQVPPR